MKVRPTTTDRHTVTVVHAGTTVVHRLDLEPAYTIWYTPQAAAVAAVATPRDWADGTDRVWADGTTRDWAA